MWKEPQGPDSSAGTGVQLCNWASVLELNSMGGSLPFLADRWFFKKNI